MSEAPEIGSPSGGDSQPRHAFVGWIVDAQEDFLRPDGRLYVKDLFDDSDIGAAQVIPALERAWSWMRTTCDAVVYTGDWHAPDDPEIDPVSPNPAKGTYPPHCMGRSHDEDERAGAQIISSIRPTDPLVLAHDAEESDARVLAERAVTERRPVFIRKTKFNVFEGNSTSEQFVRHMERALGRPTQFVVIGVARDVCVTQAVDGLQARGHAVIAVRDATWGLGLEPEQETLARWARKGRVVTLEELEGEHLGAPS